MQRHRTKTPHHPPCHAMPHNLVQLIHNVMPRHRAGIKVMAAVAHRCLQRCPRLMATLSRTNAPCRSRQIPASKRASTSMGTRRTHSTVRTPRLQQPSPSLPQPLTSIQMSSTACPVPHSPGHHTVIPAAGIHRDKQPHRAYLAQYKPRAPMDKSKARQGTTDTQGEVHPRPEALRRCPDQPLPTPKASGQRDPTPAADGAATASATADSPSAGPAELV